MASRPNVASRHSSAMRREFCAGLEAALRADADRFAQSKARSVIDGIARAVVMEAQRGKAPAIKLIFSFLDNAEAGAGVGESARPPSETPPRNEQETSVSPQQSQGICEKNCRADSGPAERREATEAAKPPEDSGGAERPTRPAPRAVPDERIEDWTNAGDLAAPEPWESKTPFTPPARTESTSDLDAETRQRSEQARNNAAQTLEPFFEASKGVRERFAAEPPGSALRIAQWRAAAEALGEPCGREAESRLRARLLQIARFQLREEETIAALRAAGDKDLETALERSTTLCAGWPRAYWLALFGAAPLVDGFSQDATSATGQSQGILRESESDGAATVRAPPLPTAIHIAGLRLER